MAAVTPNNEMEEGCEENYKYEPRVPREILNAFDSLVPENIDEQNKASLTILKYAEVEMERYNHNGGDLPADIVYIVNRLVSGLGSPRGHARHGFYTTLQALLQLQPISVSFVMNIAKKFKHGLKKMDRDSALGELLTYGALIRSGQIKNDETVRSAVIARLLELRKLKNYTEVIASQFLVDVMTMSDLDSVHMEVWSNLKESFSTPLEELTPSLLWIRLVLHGRTSLKLPPWMKSSIDPENYSAIGHVIMKTMNDLPQVHPVLQQVVASLTQKRKSDKNCMKDFWVRAIMNHLESPTHARLHLIFNFSQMLLREVKDEQEVKTILGGLLVRQLLRSVSLRDRQVDSAARGLAATLLHIMSSHSKENSEIQLAVLRAIVSPPGSVRFDKLTGTKFLQQAYKDLALPSVKGFASLLQDILQSAGYRGAAGGASKAECETAAHWVARLVNHTSVRSSEHTTWRGNQVVFLLRLSFFMPDIPKSLKASFRIAFLKSLDRPVRQLEDYRCFLMHIILEVDELVKSSNKSGEILNEEDAKYWNRVTAKLQLIEEICQKKGKDGGNDVFQVLYAYLGIQLFTESEAARESIDELNLCYKNAQKKKLSNENKKKNNTEGIDELEWIDVVVDLLISLLPRKHHLWRTVVEGVFTLLCPVMTPTALLTIADVLNPNRQEDLIGRGKKGIEDLPLVEEEDEEEEDGWETQEESDSGSDDSNDDEDDNEDDGDDEEEEEEEEDDEENDDDKEEAEDVDDTADQELADDGSGDKLLEMKRKMMTVLGGDVEDNDVDMDTLTTEEMNKLDTELGAVMKQYLGPRKKKNKTRLTKDETAVMNFRTRVCGLLDIYLKEEPSMSNTLAIIIPIMTALQVVGSDHKQDQFRNRLKSLLMYLSRIKCTSTGDARLETVVETLNDVLGNCAKVPLDSSKCIGSICIFIVRCGLQLLGDEAHNLNNPVMSVLAQHLDNFFTNNKDVIPTILAFTGPLTMHSGSIWTLSSTLLHHAFHPSTRLYRRTQAVEMLKFLYKNHKALSRVDSEAMTKFEAEITTKTIEVLDGIEGPEHVKVHYLGHLFSALKIIKQYHKQHPHLGMDWEALEGSITALRDRVSLKPFKDLRFPFNQLCQALQIHAVEISQSKNEKKIAKRLAKQEAKKNREGQMTFDKEDKPEEAKAVPGKKKRSQEWKNQRKRQLGTQVLEDLEGFNFAPQAIFDESLGDVKQEAVQSGKPKAPLKNKKSKGKKNTMNASVEAEGSASKENQKTKKNKKGKKRKTTENQNDVSSKKPLVDQD
ncbi:MYB binding protein 1a [Oratosquilla oratoria]|uniref:MYB binding protein 1a n=1 Tax=Oratosquilla oratoria TaxID=337810 RepID=UPI003F76D414